MSNIRSEIKAGIGLITLDRPKALNALSLEMVRDLYTVLVAWRDNPEVEAVAIRGSNKEGPFGAFCAGGDIKGFKSDMQAISADAVAKSNRSFGDLMIKLNEQPQVVIILVEGAAIGGGLGLVCVADVTLVTADARFRLSETSLGIPPAQIAPFVTERVGLTQARRLMLTGARFKGEEAVALGIAHGVAADVADLEAQCETILGNIKACAPGANAVTKGILFESLRRPRAEALDFASRGFAHCMLSPEGLEGVAAFVEKRSASWNK